MLAFLSEHWSEIVLSLLTAGALGVCKYFQSQAKKYKNYLKEEERHKIEETIDSKIDPILEEIEELRAYIRETKEIEKTHMGLIVSSYRFRLVQLCKCYLKKGYMTQDELDQLMEFYKLYTALGGNGQAKILYDQVMKLSIHDPDDNDE